MFLRLSSYIIEHIKFPDLHLPICDCKGAQVSIKRDSRQFHTEIQYRRGLCRLRHLSTIFSRLRHSKPLELPKSPAISRSTQADTLQSSARMPATRPSSTFGTRIA